MSPLSIDAATAVRTLSDGLREFFAAAGLSHAVLGLSGGVDSAVAAALAARALGPTSVTAILMPYRTSSPQSARDADAVARATGVNRLLLDITPQIDAYFAAHPDADALRRGNKMARERMSILFDHAKRLRALVVGTSNRSEILLGYATSFGDNACSVNPLGALYKTQVFAVARELELPGPVIAKPPSADLWEGQTDAGELGFTYEEVDPLLAAMFDEGLDDEALAGRGFPPARCRQVREIHRATAFKRRLPTILPLR